MKIIIIFFIFLNYSLGCNTNLIAKFESFQHKVNDHELMIKKIPLDLSKGNTISSMLLTDDNKDIFIGFEPNGHIYILTQGSRFDGHFFFRNNKRLKKTTLLSHGFFIQIKDINGLSNKIIDSMNIVQSKKSFNCVTEACDILNSTEQFNIEALSLKKTPLPGKFLSELISTPNLDLTFYHLSKGQLDSDLKFLRNFSIAFKNEYSNHIQKLSIKGASVLAGALSVYYLWKHVTDDEL